jgi:predicted ATPase
VKPVRIAVTGTHSTGKTTLLQRLEMEFRAEGHRVARTSGNLATRAAQLGFPKLHQQTADTTQWIIAAGICAELETALTADVVLVDRSALDPFAYYLAASELRGHQPDPADLERLRTLVEQHTSAYALLLATVLDETIPLGTHRDRDPALRRAVDTAIHQNLAEHGIAHRRLTSDTADHRAAITAALELLQPRQA